MGTYKRPLVIINPHSAGGRTGKQLDSITQTLSQYLDNVSVQTTTAPGHAIEIAAAHGPAHDLVIAVGGDGTLHEVANGLLRAKEQGALVPPLGSLPCGTGGDFRKSTKTPLEWARALTEMVSGVTTPIDVGKIRFGRPESAKYRYFVNVVSFGMGGLVDQMVATWSRRLSGKSAYFVASTLALFKAKRAELKCRIEWNGQVREEVLSTWNIAVCNGRYFGAGMMVAPMANLDDGRFEIVDLGFATRLGMLALGMWIYNGTHIGRSGIRHFPCHAIELELVDPTLSSVFCPDVDGEPVGTLPARVELLPRALSIAGVTFK
ncbi:MAG: diacylglycerol kinase family lipid kinase [Myxococcales bacterium]|nr:diacylglycerol kinase family lipid kinase [Myxococcales bacterium]